jgi:MOSC domain-containing protein YiiM
MPKEAEARCGTIIAVCISPGGIPKLPQPLARVTIAGLEGDGRAHAKHAKPDRAVSLLDEEILDQLRAEGFPVYPGAMGENLTVRGLHVQQLSPGTRLELSGGVILELTEMRKPCFVLDAIDPTLKDKVVGRCGFLARVLQEGYVRPGDTIRVVAGAAGASPAA